MILPHNASGEQLWDGCTRHLLTLCKPHSRNVHGFWWCLNELDSCSYEAVLWLSDLNRVCDCCDQSNHIMIIRGIKRFKVHKILYMCLRSVYCWNARSCAERRFCMILNFEFCLDKSIEKMHFYSFHYNFIAFYFGLVLYFIFQFQCDF